MKSLNDLIWEDKDLKDGKVIKAGGPGGSGIMSSCGSRKPRKPSPGGPEIGMPR